MDWGVMERATMPSDNGSRIIETRDEVLVQLGAGSRLVRLGRSAVLIAEPDLDPQLGALGVANGGTEITCWCSGGGGGCALTITIVSEKTVRITCTPEEGCKGCTRKRLDPAVWDALLSRPLLA
jgi:hypothetical protein